MMSLGNPTSTTMCGLPSLLCVTGTMSWLARVQLSLSSWRLRGETSVPKEKDKRQHHGHPLCARCQWLVGLDALLVLSPSGCPFLPRPYLVNVLCMDLISQSQSVG